MDTLAREREQLWAEAKVRFDAGAVLWLESAELVQMATDQQMERYEGDPWEEVIAEWLEVRPSVSISEVLEKSLQKPQALWTQTDKNRAARCLKALGWERYRERHGSRLQWRYRTEVEFPVCSRSVPGCIRTLSGWERNVVPSVPGCRPAGDTHDY